MSEILTDILLKHAPKKSKLLHLMPSQCAPAQKRKLRGKNLQEECKNTSYRMLNDSLPNVCPYPQGRNYIQNAPDSQNARLTKSLQTHPWSTCFQHAWTHKHAPTTPTHTRAEGVPTVSQRRGRERESVRTAQGGGRKWSVGNQEKERERQRCTNHICSLHCHHCSCFLMEQTVPWGRKMTNEISGIS